MGYYARTTQRMEQAYDLAMKKLKARNNPEGDDCRYKLPDMQIWAGYLGFNNTKSCRFWIEKKRKLLTSTLVDHPQYHSFSHPIIMTNKLVLIRDYSATNSEPIERSTPESLVCPCPRPNEGSEQELVRKPIFRLHC
jgi:hypothetical protein